MSIIQTCNQPYVKLCLLVWSGKTDCSVSDLGLENTKLFPLMDGYSKPDGLGETYPRPCG